MKVYVYLILVLTIVIPMTSLASSYGSGGGRSFEGGLFFGADLNRDERLDKDESKAVYNLAEKEIFARYDEDKSGYITRFEFREFLQQKPWVDKFVHPKDK